MQRFYPTKTQNAWAGMVDVWMAQSDKGDYVQYSDVRELEDLAKRLGFSSIRMALCHVIELRKELQELRAEQTVEELDHTGD